MDYLNKFKTTVSSVAAQVSQNVSQALPGNPLFREYTVQIEEQIASAGPDYCWRIYNATKNSTKEHVALWLFEKKFMDAWSKEDREKFLELIKRGVNQLTRIRHPKILTVQRGIEETRNDLAFCTEPIFASLGNCLGICQNFPSAKAKNFSNHKFHDIEVKYGILQLLDALRFLHHEIRTVHSNLAPHSVIINERGEWRLAGFEFSIQGKSTDKSNEIVYEVCKLGHRMALLDPDLNFSAPEFVKEGKRGSFSDAFSFGLLLHAIFNKSRPIFDCRGSISQYNQIIEKNDFSTVQGLQSIPSELREEVKLCLSISPQLRPDSSKFLEKGYFKDDNLLKLLEFLDKLNAMDQAQRIKFFKGLTNYLQLFPKNFLLQKILPTLTDIFLLSPMIVPFILPNLFLIAENMTNDEFSTLLLPRLLPIFKMNDPYQINLLLLEKIPIFIEKLSPSDVKTHILPLVYNSLHINCNSKVQELCLSQLPLLTPFIEQCTRIIELLLGLTLSDVHLSIRVQTLICMAKLLPSWNHSLVHDKILPALPKVPGRDAGLLMAILGIYKHTHEQSNIPREQIANSVLPHLIRISVESCLNMTQYNQFTTLIHGLMDKLEREQRQRLERLSVGQTEQKTINEFVDGLRSDGSPSILSQQFSKPIPPKMETSMTATTSDFAFLDELFAGTKNVQTGQAAKLDAKPDDGAFFPMINPLIPLNGLSNNETSSLNLIQTTSSLHSKKTLDIDSLLDTLKMHNQENSFITPKTQNNNNNLLDDFIVPQSSSTSNEKQLSQNLPIQPIFTESSETSLFPSLPAPPQPQTRVFGSKHPPKMEIKNNKLIFMDD